MSDRPRFYTDVHIAKEAVMQLRAKGVDILHCAEVGMADASDQAHLDYATSHGRVMVSCDRDFEEWHHTYLASDKNHAGIVYFRMNDQCQSISVIVKEILLLHELANYPMDLWNQFWRVAT